MSPDENSKNQTDNNGEDALKAVIEKERALRDLISIGQELHQQSGALGLVENVMTGGRIPITQKAFIAAQQKTKEFSLDEMAKFYKGLEIKSAKCLKIICLRTELVSQSEIKGNIPANTDNIPLSKITKAFRKGAASTQAIEKLISKRNPHARVAKSDQLEIPVDKVKNRLKDLKEEAKKIRGDAQSKSRSIQDDLEIILKNPNVSDKVREKAAEMQFQIQQVEEQLKKSGQDFPETQIYVEEITLGGDDFDETGASEPDDPPEEPVKTEPPPPSPKKTEPPPAPEKKIEEEEITVPERKGIISSIISWLLSDFKAPKWWPGAKKK
ncbi:MAG: hypothetical protein D6B27_00890 [Gammaproteobacteria bacterium]|nr:MAG: hypothetical protein D6B27_00890 [Gammaproteobacteria bacterium]